MYRGEAYLHQDRINSVLRTAESLQIKGLSEGPKSLDVNDQIQPSLQRWSSPPPMPPQRGPSPVHRNGGSVGIMGSMKRKADVQHHNPQYSSSLIVQHRERDREHFKMSPPPPELIPRPASSSHAR